ncbi:unnamed protein product [Caenorhabditis nigoni]
MSTTLPDIVGSPESPTGCSDRDKVTKVSCPICLKTYADKLNLERHIERIHVRKVRNAQMKKEDLERRRTVMCPVCCSLYTSRNVVKRHLERIHHATPEFIENWLLETSPKGEKYNCQTCGEHYLNHTFHQNRQIEIHKDETKKRNSP